MVLLTMTPSIVDGLSKLDERRKSNLASEESTRASLMEPTISNPISHEQIADLWKTLNVLEPSSASYSLEQLLQGSRVYIPPAPPKPEPSDHYKALMARLRREEEARSYERMINPPQFPETFRNRFPSAAHAFAEVNRPSAAADIGDDDISYSEVHRQVVLLINFMVSIAGVAATLWIAGRWWSVPARLFLTMGGSILVAVAEVAVYSGYMWRMGEAKQKQAAARELKEVARTWVLGQDDEGGRSNDKTVLLKSRGADSAGMVRMRNAAAIRDSDAS